MTFLLLLCGYKGNGKTVRTERAMAVFPPNWVTAGGPASARAGMNGQSDSTNGKNVVRCAAVLMRSFTLHTPLVD